MNLSIDYEKLLTSKSRKLLIKRLVVGSAIALSLMPLVFKDVLNSNAKLALALSGFVTSLCCLKLPDYEYEQKLIDTYEKTSLKEYKLVLQGEVLKTQTKLEINNQQDLAETIEHLPEHQIDYFAQKYGVVPILAKYYIENDADADIENTELSQMVLNETIFTRTIEKAEVESNQVFDWMRKALVQSVFLAGKKRSGKTYFMKWLLAGYIESMADKDTFYISDPHYDNADFDDPWIDPESDKKLIAGKRLVKGEKTTLAMLDEIISCLEYRKEQGLTLKKGVGRIRIFMDEVDSYSADSQEIISSAIKTIEYEAAKYGITVVLGVHSIKKGEMGIDSSVIDSMLQVLFGGIVLDSNSVLSGAYPSMAVRKARIDKYRQTTQATRVIYIKDDTDVFVSHIPDLEIPGFAKTDVKTEVKPENNSANNSVISPLERIINWCKVCKEQHGTYPSLEHIKQVWNEIAGKKLDEKGTALLREYLYKSGIEI